MIIVSKLLLFFTEFKASKNTKLLNSWYDFKNSKGSIGQDWSNYRHDMIGGANKTQVKSVQLRKTSTCEISIIF